MELDDLDWALLDHLQADARTSYNELARRVGASAPTVAARVRRMEESEVITGYRAEVDPSGVGLGVQALVRMKCYGPRCITLRPEQISDWPEVLGVLRLTGDICSLVHVATPDVARLERLLERLWEYGETASAMILSWPVPMRGVRRPPAPPGGARERPGSATRP
ncbi:Lrp/AsnC family leucine-responsive transcriptional regulator [Actinoalloteichus hoggarensis]|uniref:HTH-type transcriptional regulator LrpC n=1 Tax=Actinoalloteichus hoggarensis TaxID=1470176 RepID=A0A221WB96_9PSEU|nr:Lrp/AsnC family transcriptional regulator [Actinoalloteichus hoggarensis]ASO22931.1 HTH-type transcriptional regulator LrpC [Actinoalloteichus hoggarensis]MBB5922535.1 Lrp/AsnC family leucine-responsive transcriptional regulator [Actinoalloteichus hoggarensis]